MKYDLYVRENNTDIQMLYKSLAIDYYGLPDCCIYFVLDEIDDKMLVLEKNTSRKNFKYIEEYDKQYFMKEKAPNLALAISGKILNTDYVTFTDANEISVLGLTKILTIVYKLCKRSSPTEYNETYLSYIPHKKQYALMFSDSNIAFAFLLRDLKFWIPDTLEDNILIGKEIEGCGMQIIFNYPDVLTTTENNINFRTKKQNFSLYNYNRIPEILRPEK